MQANFCRRPVKCLKITQTTGLQPSWQLDAIRYEQDKPADHFISLGEMVKLLWLSLLFPLVIMMIILVLDSNSS